MNKGRVTKGLACVAVTMVMLCGMLLPSCIKNDLPFPKIQQNILAIEAVGQSAPALIDSASLQVTLYLKEQTDPRKVSFTEFDITPGAECDPFLLRGTYDLTRPIIVTLSRYQSYEWVVKAEHEIEREFVIEGQIGTSVIDAAAKRVIVKVPDIMNLSRLNLVSMKLGPAMITTYSPELKPGEYDFSHPVDIDVTYWDTTETWTIYVEASKLLVSTTSADAWSQVIWVKGEAPATSVNGVEYREASSDTWLRAPDRWVTHSGGSFTAALRHLKPLTQYVVRAVSDDNIGNEITVTTDATVDIVDGSFDQWWLDGKVWCPWSENGEPYWDTGNTGAATLGQSNVTPSDYTPAGVGGQSAKLDTKFVGIGSVGKLAAGSIYTGSFKKVDGTNGILDFGRPFTLRPTKLRGYYQYTTAEINYADADHKHLLGLPDTCQIYIALADWTAPFEIRTNPKNRNLFNPSAPEIIAYGTIQGGDSFEGYREFEIDLEYRSTSRVPRYLLITCAASKFGDFFTGGAGACLYVDQLSFGWDLDD